MEKELKILNIFNPETGEKDPLYLTDKQRKDSLLVLGKRGYELMPEMYDQDLDNRDAGITVITAKRATAYDFYAMAKAKHRKVILLKPEVHFEILNKFLWTKSWDYEYVAENIIDFKKEIKDKTVIIIDMEYNQYRTNAIRATAMLLLQFQLDMLETNATLRRNHNLYIGNAQRYLPFIETFLSDGADFNINTTLFIPSLNQLKTFNNDYSSSIENNVKNFLLMPDTNINDVTKYVNSMYLQPEATHQKIYNLIHRNKNTVAFRVSDEDKNFKDGVGEIVGMELEKLESINKNALKHRKRLRVEFNDDIIQRKILKQEKNIYKKFMKQFDNGDDVTYLEEIENQISKEVKETKEENKKSNISPVVTPQPAKNVQEVVSDASEPVTQEPQPVPEVLPVVVENTTAQQNNGEAVGEVKTAKKKKKKKKKKHSQSNPLIDINIQPSTQEDKEVSQPEVVTKQEEIEEIPEEEMFTSLDPIDNSGIFDDDPLDNLFYTEDEIKEKFMTPEKEEEPEIDDISDDLLDQLANLDDSSLFDIDASGLGDFIGEKLALTDAEVPSDEPAPKKETEKKVMEDELSDDDLLDNYKIVITNQINPGRKTSRPYRVVMPNRNPRMKKIQKSMEKEFSL